MTIDRTARAAVEGPRSLEELEGRLSSPTTAVIDALQECPGDVVVLGAGGKMGASFARMVRRATEYVGDARRVFAVSRFTSPGPAEQLEEQGVIVVRADLSDRDSLAQLPDAPNVLFLAGQKFGTRDLPAVTWVANVVVPAAIADRYRTSRIVALSTGNVYPLVRADGEGARENQPVAPVGEYAWTCVGRERVLQHAAETWGTQVSIVRLNYAVDLRYGVLVDVALKVWRGEPVDVRMGYANVIWQGDACAQVLQCLPRCSSPPFIVNISGPERLSIRTVALELGRLLDRVPTVIGEEGADALLSDTTLAQSLFGPPSVSADTLLAWVAEWVRNGNPLLQKATHFEEREGRF